MLRAGIIGCGRSGPGSGGGHSIGRAHAQAYQQIEGVELVAAADIDEGNLRQFAQEYGVGATYRDYRAMLQKEHLDLLSVAVWPPLHEEMVVAGAQAGVRGTMCEKPMTLSLAAADHMLAECKEHGTLLCVNHQRRYGDPWRKAKALVASGAIGNLERVELSCPEWDILSWGTHWIDIANFYADDAPVDWVFAQMDTSRRLERYGHLVENDGLVEWRYASGIRALLHLGDGAPPGFFNRLSGSEGMIEVHVPDQPPLRVWGRDQAGWVAPNLPQDHRRAFAESLRLLADGVQHGTEPPNSAPAARRVMEVIMAAYESAYRRQRVELPLRETGFTLEKLVTERTFAGNADGKKEK